MRRRVLVQGAAAALVAGAGPAPALVVAELFTSQGCSSCPPADRLLTELSQTRPDILPLAFHVTYWDGRAWSDPFSLEAATARQRQYARLLGLDTVYTPQLVVGGRQDVFGSDRTAVLDALAARPAASVGVLVTRQDGQARIGVDAGAGAGTILLVGFDRQHQTAVGGGENSGRTLLQTNVVRALVPAGGWNGMARRLTLPAPASERLAVLLQSQDGSILGAAREIP